GSVEGDDLARDARGRRLVDLGRIGRGGGLVIRGIDRLRGLPAENTAEQAGERIGRGCGCGDAGKCAGDERRGDMATHGGTPRLSVRRGRDAGGAPWPAQRWARSATGMRTSSDTLSPTRRSMVMTRFTVRVGLPSAVTRHCWAR